VVERPASVLKELLENSLDAGARQIEVEVRGAGTALVRVTDDGAGMDREDALMAIERHATSKITSAADLSAVRTMGFRGEALPSIASVSEFRLLTRPAQSECGTEVAVRGGKLSFVRDAGCAAGTTTEVKSLFFNVPARRKFLRSAATETAHLDRAIETLALAFPSVAIRYLRDGRDAHRLPATEDLGVRVKDLFGAEERAAMVDVPEFEQDGIRVTGLVSRPGATRADRTRQFFFVNGRAVESGFLAAGLREAFHQMLDPGRHPSVVLHLAIDPGEVDCNVHPAKREVRFRRGGAVRDAVSAAIGGALRAARAEWLKPAKVHVMARIETRPPAPSVPAAAPAAHHQPALPVASAPEARSAEMVVSGAGQSGEAAARGGSENFRLIGALSLRYLLLEGGEGLVLLDMAAARRRILFERLQRGAQGVPVSSQRLLPSVVLELGPREHEVVASNARILCDSGFLIEPFGTQALKVEALPDFLAGRDPRRVLEEFAAECLHGESRPRGPMPHEAVRRAVARMGARDGDVRDEREQRALVVQLLACELPYCDPDGRPVMLQFSWRELDRKFGRD
ncbi:MAG: DNA mismatch repair endonuclease MutL, partial [Chthoniobacterales bacterium]|nr:DNA mismatch repair endonuclease MutL [Chthoniobacterales bacterium]